MSAEIGKRLESVRLGLGETQRGLSAKLGLGANAWGNFEKDGRLPKTEQLQALASMGISLDWLATGHGSMWIAGGGDEGASVRAETPVSSHEVVIPILVAALVTTARASRQRGVPLSDEETAQIAATLYADVASRSEAALEEELRRLMAGKKVG